MKILFHYPEWGNRWIPYLTKELSKYNLKISHSANIKELNSLCEWADVLISPWANEMVGFWTQRYPNKKIICWLRRFEFWEKKLHEVIDFSKINAMIFVNEWYKKKIDGTHIIPKTYLIYNGIDIDEFKLKKPAESHKIAFVGQLKHVKNFALALQILMELPKKYTLHHIGLPASSQMQGEIWSYTDNLGLMDRVKFYHPLKREAMINWYSDKDFILSTSLNEGNPNCVIEAMAMGMKPVVHDWPGARDQFPEDLIFRTLREAKQIFKAEYEPKRYRNWVKEHYSYDNLKRIHEVIKDVVNK